MKPILVVYATREGHTRKVADRVCHRIEQAGRSAVVTDARRGHFEPCDGVVLATSVHMGDHDPTMVDYVRYHREKLWKLPNAFVSVSLHEAVHENPSCSPLEQDDAKVEVDRSLRLFAEETGFHPQEVHPVAGALLYSSYGFLKRLVMQRMAKDKGLSADTSQDHDYTDWKDVDQFVDGFLSRIERHRATDSTEPPVALA